MLKEQRKKPIINRWSDKQFFKRKIAIIFLSISFKHLFRDAQKNRLIQTILLSTHNVCLLKKLENNMPSYSYLKTLKAFYKSRIWG